MKVELLIGQDVPEAIIPQEVRSTPNGPYAVRTSLGWSINGPLHEGTDSHTSCNFISLDAAVERFWKLENPGEDDGLSQEDRAAVNVWKSSAKMEDGHYHLDIPFRNNPPKLMNNR